MEKVDITMKVAITGHSKGLGKALKNCFESNGHTVMGFSRSNGYDISNCNDRSNIVTESAECDVFINNAWFPDVQQLMLSEVCDAFENTNKVIINISSMFVYIDEDVIQGNTDFCQYRKDKIAGHQMTMKTIMSPNPNIMNVVAGLIDTELAANLAGNKMDAKDVAELIYFMYDNRDKVMVRDITIAPFVNFSTSE